MEHQTPTVNRSSLKRVGLCMVISTAHPASKFCHRTIGQVGPNTSRSGFVITDTQMAIDPLPVCLSMTFREPLPKITRVFVQQDVVESHREVASPNADVVFENTSSDSTRPRRDTAVRISLCKAIVRPHPRGNIGDKYHNCHRFVKGDQPYPCPVGV